MRDRKWDESNIRLACYVLLFEDDISRFGDLVEFSNSRAFAVQVDVALVDSDKAYLVLIAVATKTMISANLFKPSHNLWISLR